jgi:hypothetical protein
MDLGSLWTRNDLASSSEQSPPVEWQCRSGRLDRPGKEPSSTGTDRRASPRTRMFD